ncbi:MAG: phosphate ABC transporter substrate-binding protein [Syntrophomonadaceae bacterium]|jgi:phosphate transport system substrate-binding protein
MDLSKVRKYSSIFMAGLLLSGVFLIAGCGKTDSNASPQDSAALSGSLTVAGSTSVQPFSEVLAEEFMAAHKGTQINVQGGGSSVGIEAAISGTAQIGAVSRSVSSEEKSKGLVDTAIALDGIAVIVHPSNPIASVKSTDVMNIYLGNIKNWKELGGADAPITVVSREEGSGTREAFTALVMNKKDTVKTAVVQNSTGAVRTTVAGDKNAIGYISLSSLNQEVKALQIDGVEATEGNVKNGSYKLQRPFIYVTKGEATGLEKAFIDFILSPEGQKLLVEEGAISVK